MKKIYFDEKGPQETFKESNMPSSELPIRHGNDLMKSYVICGFIVDDKNDDKFYKEFLKAIEIYKNNSGRQFDISQEIKGKEIFKNIERGFSSLTNDQCNLIFKIKDIFDSFECNLQTISSSKYAMITGAKLGEWLLSSRRINPELSPYRLKFSITKYLEESASPDIVKAFLDERVKVNYLLKMIKEDLETIRKKSSVPKYNLRNENYKIIIDSIRRYKKNRYNVESISTKPDHFQWNRIRHFIELLLLELNYKNPDVEYELFADKGIPSSIFPNIKCVIKYTNNCDSKEIKNIQVADFFAALIGKLIAQIAKDSKPRNNITSELIYLPEKYYELSENQFLASKYLCDIVFKQGMHYSVCFDTYGEDELIFQSYLEYINDFSSYSIFKKQPVSYHQKRHFDKYKEMMEYKLNLGDITLQYIKASGTNEYNELREQTILLL